MRIPTIRALHGLGAALAACAAISVQAQSTVTTNLLSETTFGPEAASPWGYGYFYGNNGLGLQEYNRAYFLPEDVEMTNAVWQFTFDLTDLAGTLGYGAGTGGPLFRTDTDPASFVSTNREDYVFSFDARVEGLAEGQTAANAEMQVQFYYPDENGTAVKSLQVNLPFQPTAEWKRFTFSLDQGGLGDNTADAEFALRHDSTSEVRFNVNIHEPHNAFGYDGPNALYLDNTRLEVINRPQEEPVVLTGVTMAEWNFDDRVVGNVYQYEWSQNDQHMTVTAENNAGANSPNTSGVNGSSAWIFNFDNTVFADNPPQWAGGGTGGAGEVDFTQFNTGDLDLYRITFDARVAGLNERTNSAAVLQIFLDAADDTLLPADEDTNADALVRLDYQISRVSPEWQTYSFILGKGAAGSGSKANFTNHFAAVTELRTQWQVENTASFADWGYDADNSLFIDNVRIERLYVGLGTISAARQGDNLVLTWSAGNGARLQQATSVTGPYTDVEGAASGHATPLSGTARFFRLAQ